MVIRELVVEDPHQAWRSREVCRTFADAIKADIIMNQPRAKLKMVQPQKSDCAMMVERNMAQCLRYRMKKPLGVNPDLPNAIAKMTDYICTTVPKGGLSPGTRFGTLSAQVLFLSSGRATFSRCCGR